MSDRAYGVANQTVCESELACQVEEVTLNGFTVIPDVIPSDELAAWRQKIDAVYEVQQQRFGRETLASISELDICRAPLLYDLDFLTLATRQKTWDIVKAFLGDWFILSLQNAIINRPKTEHHQSAWHRDLPYQNLVTSRPLGINVLLAIDEFSAETGSTNVLPYSHRAEALPSTQYLARNHVAVTAPAGSAIIFDVMLFHKAGSNRSNIIRRGVNQLFTSPVIKQQFDFANALSPHRSRLDPQLLRLLGFTSQIATDDNVWREQRLERLRGGA